MLKRIAMISEHASPLAMLGGIDAGGQNVYVGQLARHLGTLGYEIDVLTRRDSPLLPETAEWWTTRAVPASLSPSGAVGRHELGRIGSVRRRRLPLGARLADVDALQDAESDGDADQ